MGINLSLRGKLQFLILAVVICFGGAISCYLVTRVADKFSGELLNRGEILARHLAELSSEAFIEHDHLRLQYLAQNHQATNPDILYILMVNREGRLLAHSFGATYPAELTVANRYLGGQKAVIKRLDTSSEIIYDIAVPVLDGRVGSLRVGMSAKSVSETVTTLIKEILIAIAIIGALAFALTLPVARAITQPLFRLTQAIEGLSAGRRDLHLPIDRRDEIGVLNDSFNQMATDVHKAEKRLSAQVQFLRILMEDLPIPVFYRDIEGRMQGCNSSFAEFWGKSVDEIIGHGDLELYSPEDAGLHRAKDAELLRGAQPIAYELAVYSADGSRHYINFHKALYRDEDEQPAGIIGVMYDATQQREAAQMKSEFLSTVAHEFQTPLATILGFCELIAEGSLSDEESKDALRLIIQKSEGLSEMVDELLDLARLENGRVLSIDKEHCDLNQLLVGIIDSFRLRIDTRNFSLELPTPPIVIDLDRKRIGQVMENLLSNAVKYSGLTSTIHVAAVSNRDVCQIIVRDEGIGMAPKQLKHLFDKFYRANSSNTSPTGTGLGMFITKSIVDAHRGDIHADSIVGQGTTVTVALPIEAGV